MTVFIPFKHNCCIDILTSICKKMKSLNFNYVIGCLSLKHLQIFNFPRFANSLFVKMIIHNTLLKTMKSNLEQYENTDIVL